MNRTVLHRSVLVDGAMDLFADAALATAVERWAPRFPHLPAPASPSAAARIDLLVAHSPPAPPPTIPATFRLAGVSAWMDEGAQKARLRAADSSAAGEVDLIALRAEVRSPAEDEASAEKEMDIFTMLTISAAVLLGRMERALVHAAAFVAPNGGGWLLIGDTHAGKTTTTLNLIRAGYRYLSDDHVVLFADPATGDIRVEGWPRTFHVDAGWERGEVTGRRMDLDPATLGADRWVRTAPLAGLLFPQVVAASASEVALVTPATALSLLMRQSPWFVADGVAAPRVLALLQKVAILPAFHLILGRDSYSDFRELCACLDPIVNRADGGA